MSAVVLRRKNLLLKSILTFGLVMFKDKLIKLVCIFPINKTNILQKLIIFVKNL